MFSQDILTAVFKFFPSFLIFRFFPLCQYTCSLLYVYIPVRILLVVCTAHHSYGSEAMMNLSSLDGGLCSWTEKVQLENSVIQVHWANTHTSFKITFLCANRIIVFNYRTPKSRHTSGWKICSIFHIIFFFCRLSERFLIIFYQI